jgi:hypothetical protein
MPVPLYSPGFIRNDNQLLIRGQRALDSLTSGLT